MARLDQTPDQLYLLWDKLRCLGLHLRPLQAQRFTVPVKTIGPAPGEVGKSLFCLTRTPDGLVIHVRQVADVPCFASRRLPDPNEQVLNNETPEVTNVGRAVDRRSTGIKLQRLSVVGG